MPKITEEAGKRIIKMAYAGAPNKEIARELGMPVSDVYAYRSRKGITLDKIRAAKTTSGAASSPTPAAATEPRTCKNCRSTICHAAGKFDTVSCDRHQTSAERKQEFQILWKQDFLLALGRTDLGIGSNALHQIHTLLDRLIPEREDE